jgi:hypothetical protein
VSRFSIGDRVQVCPEPTLVPERDQLPQHRGVTGTVVAPLNGSYEHVVCVEHQFGATEPPGRAWYYTSDLTLLTEREVATGGEQTPLEQRLTALEKETAELRAIFADWQTRVVDRLDAMVAEPEPAEEQPAPDCSDALEACRSWCGLTPEQRQEIADIWLPKTTLSKGPPMMLDALAAVPSLVRAVEQRALGLDPEQLRLTALLQRVEAVEEQQRLAIQYRYRLAERLSVLEAAARGAEGQQPPRDDETAGDAPVPPSDLELVELRARVAQLEETLRQAEQLRQRNSAALKTLQDAFGLSPHVLVTEAANDAASRYTVARAEQRRLLARLSRIHDWLYSLLPEEDEISADAAMDLIAGRYGVWQRLSAPEAYDVRDPVERAGGEPTPEQRAVDKLADADEIFDFGNALDGPIRSDR